MTTPSSLQKTPTVPEILTGSFAVICAAPLILGLFLASGFLSHIIPSIFGSVVRLALMSIGVVIAYRGLDGEKRTEEALWRRLFMAVIATFISYFLFIIAILSLIIVRDYNYVVALVLALLGLYVYARLFLATPAVMIDGYGPFEALSASWELTENIKWSTTTAVILVYAVAFVGLLSLLMLFRVKLIVVNIGSVFIIDSLLVGMQAFLYQMFAETSEPIVRNDTDTNVRNVTG